MTSSKKSADAKLIIHKTIEKSAEIRQREEYTAEICITIDIDQHNCSLSGIINHMNDKKSQAMHFRL